MNTHLPGSSIVSSSGKAALLDTYSRRIAERMTASETGEAHEMLQMLRAQLIAEKESAGAAVTELVHLTEKISLSRSADELAPLCTGLKELIAAQFAIRPSAATLHSITHDFYDRLLSRTLDFATDGSENTGAIFVSGELGRKETLCARRSCILFIYPDGSNNNEPAAKTSAGVLEQLLTTLLPYLHTSPGKASSWLWSGSISEWRGMVSASYDAVHADREQSVFGFSGMTALLADMRFVCGDSDLAATITVMNRNVLTGALTGEYFKGFARDVSSMQVALGIFGRFKTVKSGRHKGELPLTQQVITPLVDAVRIFAVATAIAETATADRIRALTSRGLIGVALGEKLLAAWQVLTQEATGIELTDSMADELFLAVDDLDEETREQLKDSLEDIATLQRLLYQQISGDTSL